MKQFYLEKMYTPLWNKSIKQEHLTKKFPSEWTYFICNATPSFDFFVLKLFNSFWKVLSLVNNIFYFYQIQNCSLRYRWHWFVPKLEPIWLKGQTIQVSEALRFLNKVGLQ